MPGIKACDALVEIRVDAEGNIVDGAQEDLNKIVNENVWPTFFGTPVYERFAEIYAWDEIAQDRIVELYSQRFPNYPYTCRNLEEVFGDLLLIGDPRLNPANVPEPVAPEPAHLKRTREQRQLREEILADLEVFSGVSTKAIERKRATRPEYNAMWKEMRQPEFAKEDLPELTDELKNFAIAYNATPGPSLKKVGGVYRLKDIPFGEDKFFQLFDAAQKLGLVR